MRQLLVARDYQETITYSFVDKQWEVDFCANVDPVMLANPIAAQMNAMRSSMLGSLVDCLRLNLSRQQSRVRLFEIGRCFRAHRWRCGFGVERARWLGVWRCGARAMGFSETHCRLL